jgi:hypothetical protein
MRAASLQPVLMRAGLRFVAVVAVAGLALTACGGGDDDGDQSLEESIEDAVEEGNLEDLPEEVEDAVEDSDGDNGNVPEACELVTLDDAEGLFGEPAQEQEEASPVDLGSACDYGNVDGQELGQVAHLLQVGAFDGEQFYGAEVYEDEEALDGVGDKGFVYNGESATDGVEVQFVKDGTTVTLSYSTVNIGVENDADEVIAADHEKEVVELARQAADRM